MGRVVDTVLLSSEIWFIIWVKGFTRFQDTEDNMNQLSHDSTYDNLAILFILFQTSVESDNHRVVFAVLITLKMNKVLPEIYVIIEFILLVYLEIEFNFFGAVVYEKIFRNNQ